MIPVPVLLTLLGTALADEALKKQVMDGLRGLVDDPESEWDDVTLRLVDEAWGVLVTALSKR